MYTRRFFSFRCSVVYNSLSPKTAFAPMSSQSNLAHRPTYSQQQIRRYFNYISFPPQAQQHVPDMHEKGKEHSALEFLRLLQIHQLSSIPFENLSLHYSTHHTVSMDPDGLYEKLVSNRRGRGGYCLENNCFLGTVLRSLGFEIYSAGARVCKDGVNYGPWWVVKSWINGLQEMLMGWKEPYG